MSMTARQYRAWLKYEDRGHAVVEHVKIDPLFPQHFTVAIRYREARGQYCRTNVHVLRSVPESGPRQMRDWVDQVQRGLYAPHAIQPPTPYRRPAP